MRVTKIRTCFLSHLVIHAPLLSICLPCRVMVHIVAQCHEEGLEHYLRSYVKVNQVLKHSAIFIAMYTVVVFCSNLGYMIFFLLFQYVFKTESYPTNNSKTVHEEVAKAMTSILKPSTDFLTSNKLLKVVLF